MPGIVVFRRRWSVGSDDLVVPAIFFLILHGAWLVVLSVIRGVVHFDTSVACTRDLALHLLGYIGVLGVSFLLEFAIALVSLRGSILDLQPRAAMQYLLYVRLVVLLVEVAWLVVGVVWAFQHYQDCQPVVAKKAFLVVIICNWLLVMSVIISLWCTFDSAGRKWVKMKKFQDSLKEKKRVYRRTSGSHRRNWRQRHEDESRNRLVSYNTAHTHARWKAIRAYEESWDRRLKLLCCCVERKGRNQNSMSEIAQLFTEFFRDLDVVPSDVVAGLVLLRKFQKGRMGMVVQQPSNDVYQYLSGVAITPQTQFLQLSQPEVLSAYRLVLHYMYYALAAYGWPLYVMMNTGSWFCRLIPSLSCCCCCGKTPRNTEVIEDNCCLCNYAALKRISQLSDSELVYATYHVDIGETPFYVALDHKHRKVVVCVRGTLSLQDVLTDLQAEPESLPLQPPREEWLAHKGMVQAAVYIKKKLEDDGILERAFERDPDKQTQTYDLILVGHSLGAGTAAILAILLQPDYPTLHCYAYSPPGGLLSMACCEETKEFITSVVVGKDVVPRIGLPQMEILRTDLINVIKGSTDPKWKIIAQGLCCCGAVNVPSKAESQRDVTAHPSDSGIGLSAHTPLYPPGKIIHIVRSHPKENKSLCKRSKPVYQAVWANNADFDEVLISPTMINDHMPDYVLEALEKVLAKAGPPKPCRTLTEAERKALLSQDSGSSPALPSPALPSPARGPLLEAEQPPPRPPRGEPNLQISFADSACPPDQPACLAVDPGEGGDWLEAAQGSTLGGARPGGWGSEEGGEEVGGWARPEQLALPEEGREWVRAPLASPETLSLASTAGHTSLAGGSMAGGSQAGGGEGRRRSQGSPGEPVGGATGWGPDVTGLATIEQSPELLHRDPAAPASAASPGGLHGGPLQRNSSSFGSSQGGREGTVRAGESSFDSGMEEGVCSVHVTSETLDLLPERDSVALCRQEAGTEGGRHVGGNSDSLGVGSTSPSISSPGTALDGFDSEPPWHRHSPVETTQFEYGHPNVHYSAASLGYPHGAYEPPMDYLPYLQNSHVLGDDNNPIPRPLDALGSSLDGESNVHNAGTNENGSANEEQCSPETSKEVKTKEKERALEEEEEDDDPRETDPLWTPRSLGNLLAECSKVAGMRRSHERMDIAHLQDESEVFEERVGGGMMLRGRLVATPDTPQTSVTAPPSDPSQGPRLPSNQSDEVFEGQGDSLV